MYHEPSSRLVLLDHAKPPSVPSPGGGGSAPAPTDISSEDTISNELKQHIADIEQRLNLLADSEVHVLDEDLRSYACSAVESRDTAMSASHYAIVFAWATGSVFNLAKERLAHGQFGPWRDRMATETGISVRTAQNWMKLANECSDVRAMLVPGGKLTSAFRAAGVLPKPPNPPSKDKNGGGSDVPPCQPVVEIAFTALASGRKALRHLEQAGVVLSEEDSDRLTQEKSAYAELFDKLLNSAKS